MTITPTPNWQRAMRRAVEQNLKPTRRPDGTYRVPSGTVAGRSYIVSLTGGHISHCTCKGWERYGRSNPCKHCGAVSLAILYLKGISISPAQAVTAEAVVEAAPTTRNQMFKTRAA